MAEYIGSRISLISVRNIRYVGTLHQINSEDSTVALEQVKSYGTEGRDPENEILPSDNVYEYIVFRGSDVKDLRIEKEPEKKTAPQPQVPDDPAILGRDRPVPPPSATTTQSQNQQPPRQAPIGPHPPQNNTPFQNHQHFPSQQNQSQAPGRFNQPPSFPYQYPIPNQRFGPQPPQGFPPYGYPMPYGSPPPGWFPPPGQGFPHPPPGQYFQPPGPFGPPGQPATQQAPQSKPQTPAEPITNKDQGLAATQQPIEKPTATVKLPTPPSSTAVGQSGPPPPTESKPDVAAALAPPAPPVATDVPAVSKQVPNGQKSGRIMPAIPMLSPAVKAKAPVVAEPNAGAVNTVAPRTQKPAATPSTQAPTKSLEDANRDARAAVAAAMAKLPQASGQGPKKQANGESAIDNLTNKVNEMKTQDNIRNSRQPGTGGYAAGHRGGRGYRGGRSRDEQTAKKMEVPKTDYDFASANAKFNKQDLVKEAIASGSPISSPIESSNNPSANTSINGARRESEASVSIPAAAGYNKTSSFFDNISSESRDRDDKKLGGREFRNEERKLNLETFGQGSVDNGYRGGYRGRGRGRGSRGARGSYAPSRGRGGTRGRGAVAAESQLAPS